MAPVIRARKGYHTDIFKKAFKQGIQFARVDGARLPIKKPPKLKRFTEHSIDLETAEVNLSKTNTSKLEALVEKTLSLGNGALYVDEDLFSEQLYCPTCQISYEELDPRLFSFNSRHGWCPKCQGMGFLFEWEEETFYSGQELTELMKTGKRTCPDCDGKRLKPQALAVKIKGESVDALTTLSAQEALGYFQKIEFQGREKAISQNLLKEILERLICPPCVPAPGPKSSTSSAARMVASSCSTTIRLFPFFRNSLKVSKSIWLSRLCNPMVGSSKM